MRKPTQPTNQLLLAVYVLYVACSDIVPLAAVRCSQACVGRSLEFADATSCYDLGAACDEWVAAFDSSVVSFDECAIHLELDSFPFPTSKPLSLMSPSPTPRPPGEQSSKDDDLFPMETDDWPMGMGAEACAACAQLEDATMPPEARPPWENAAAADSRVVVCERVLPSYRSQQARRVKTPFASPPAIVPSEEAWRRELRPRR